MASLANGIPASWRLNEGLSRRAAALATPPRLPTKRKYEDESNSNFYLDDHQHYGYGLVSGIAPLGVTLAGPVAQFEAEMNLQQNQLNKELAAGRMLDNKERLNRAAERKERIARRLRKQLRDARVTREEDEYETPASPLRDYEEHYGHGCEFDPCPPRCPSPSSSSSDEEEDDKKVSTATNINNGAVNVNFICPH